MIVYAVGSRAWPATALAYAVIAQNQIFTTVRDHRVSLAGKLKFVGETDTGRVREHNEDAIAFDPDIGLLVLADGMGGYNAGEVASGIAVKTVVNLVREFLTRENMKAIDAATGLSRPSIILRDAIARANKIIFQTARSQPQCEGMGTTIVGALFYDNRISIAHVGDSRLYRIRGGRVQQVTSDHSLLQELVDRGFYTPEEAQRAANKNYVTRALGVEPAVDVDIQEVAVEKGDHFLVCSDGLSDMVQDDDMHLTLSTFGANLEAVAKQLIQLANNNGGRDNISVIIAEVVDGFPAERRLVDRVLSWFS
ncbi:MAG: Stp1/IreP family PP2C-type Ser/Thr phosphatase [Steroidobacteraceae bacterium]